jgi:hypothetical protein
MPDDRTIRHAPPAADDSLDLRGLMRLAGWAAGAVCALAIAVLASRSEPGAQRVSALFGQPAPAQAMPEASPLTARTSDLEFETRQLTTALRSLSTDRDRLLARVTVLERNLEDVTGSISKVTAARPVAPAAAEQQAPPQPEAPETVEASGKPEPAPNIRLTAIGPSLVATMSSPLEVPTPTPETLARVGLSPIPVVEGNLAMRTQFGVDVGTAANLAALRGAWRNLRKNHGNLFEGLHPVVAVRDGGKPGGVELHMIVGPLVNAAAAARLCGTLGNAGLSCQPAIFDGQRLALR